VFQQSHAEGQQMIGTQTVPACCKLSSLMLKGSRALFFMVGPQSLPSLFLAELGCSVYIPSKDYMLAFSQANRLIKQLIINDGQCRCFLAGLRM